MSDSKGAYALELRADLFHVSAKQAQIYQAWDDGIRLNSNLGANRVRFISAYQCVKSAQTTNTVYLQHKRYFDKTRGSSNCPRDMFRSDLI